MKKLYKNLVVSLLIVVTLLVFASCSFINPYKIDNLPPSLDKSTDIVINNQESLDRKLLSNVDAVSMVDRSCVAIQTSNSMGSGVIVDIDDKINKSGEYYVITCQHVIDGLGKTTVYVPDENGRNFGDDDYNEDFAFTAALGGKIDLSASLQLVGGDEVSDVAVLKLRTTKKQVQDNIVKAKVIDSSKYSLQKGESVFAIGNPTGYLPGTATFGNVSYIGRIQRIAEKGYMSLIQIDTTSHPGNSGGGLFNMYGELVGITNAGNVAYVGLNYAIPYKTISDLKTDRGFISIATQLIGTHISQNQLNYGYVSGRYNFGMITSQNSTSIDGITVQNYIEIKEIVENSNADLAGLCVGDIITGVDYVDRKEQISAQVSTISDLSNIMSIIKSTYSVGDSFSFVIIRNKVELKIKTTIVKEGYIFADTGIYS